MATLSQPVLQNAFLGLRKELPRLLTAGFLGRLFLAALSEGQGERSVFGLILGLYEALGQGADPVLCGLWGQDRLLGALGVAPHLESCTLCDHLSLSGFCAEDGGMLCDDCYHGSGFALQPEVIELARQIRKEDIFSLCLPQSLASIRLLGRVYKEQFQTQLGLSAALFRKVL